MPPCFQFTESGTCSYGDQCKFDHVVSTSLPTATVGKKRKNKGKKKKTQVRPNLMVNRTSAFITDGHLFFSKPAPPQSATIQPTSPQPVAPQPVYPTYFEGFFSSYPEFTYNPTQPIMKEFYRMCNTYGWGPYDSEKTEARDGVRDAIAQTFNAIYGTDMNDLRSWHNLFHAIHIDPLPENIQSCREVCLTFYHMYLCMNMCRRLPSDILCILSSS